MFLVFDGASIASKASDKQETNLSGSLNLNSSQARATM